MNIIRGLLLLLLSWTIIQQSSALAGPSHSQRRYNRLPVAAPSSIGEWEKSLASSLILSETTDSICKHCHCQRNTAICDFVHNQTLSRIWNSAYSVPQSVTGIEVTLERGTQLELHEGFFRPQNRVNRFVVNGVQANDQVELTHDAFRNNQGGYPDIQILNVAKVFLRENSFSGGEFKLHVEHSQELILFKGAFSNMNMSCSFAHIGQLVMHEKAFNPSTDRSARSHVNLHIEAAHMERIYSFEVSMNKISFTKSTIGSILTHAFDVTKINELFFEDCRIETIEAKAFTSKLQSEHVSITGTIIGTIDSEAIMGSGISKLTLKNNTINDIKSEALQIYSVDVFIQENTVNHLASDWLMVKNGEQMGGAQIVVENNHFTDFQHMDLGPSKHFNCTFANNWLGLPQTGSLNFTSCQVHRLSVDRSCSCDSSYVNSWTDHDLSSEIFCLLSKREQDCFNASSVNQRRYANEACGGVTTNRTLQCMDGSKLVWRNGQFITKEEIARLNRGLDIGTVILWLVVGMACLILLAGSAALLYVCCRRRKSQAHTSSNLHKCEFSETERKSLQAEASLLKEGSHWRKRLQELISGKLTVNECNDLITDIVNNMPDLPSGINIKLSCHLDRHHADAIYHQQQLPPPISLPSAPPSSAVSQDEPIYEEPQQPLLSSEYASPHEGTAPVYSEPINSSASKYGGGYEYDEVRGGLDWNRNTGSG